MKKYSMNEIVIENLSKRYRRTFIFKGVNLILDSNKYNFLVGSNGTGKSTFIKCLLGEVKYEGVIEIQNKIIAYAPERINLPDYVSVSNFLLLLSRITNKEISLNKEKMNYYIKHFFLEPYVKMPICKLSQGNRQKLILIQALMTEGDIYIFDEPLTGLDETSQKAFLNELRIKKNQQKMIIISTHRLDAYRFRNKNIIHFPLGGAIND